ncbi:MAG: hypothetical protein HC846_02105 [Blastocatellia bacterium]|nr:hypothetical protein [Blastocatellia bacterium]
MDENLYLTARLKVKADKVEELKQAALAIVDDSRSEEGCISYNVHQSIEDETVFVWRECWRTKLFWTSILKWIMLRIFLEW